MSHFEAAKEEHTNKNDDHNDENEDDDQESFSVGVFFNDSVLVHFLVCLA